MSLNRPEQPEGKKEASKAEIIGFDNPEVPPMNPETGVERTELHKLRKKDAQRLREGKSGLSQEEIAGLGLPDEYSNGEGLEFAEPADPEAERILKIQQGSEMFEQITIVAADRRDTLNAAAHNELEVIRENFGGN